MASRKLWIFRVSGGESFRLQPKGNPVMVHDGRPEGVLKCLCTAEQAQMIEAQIRDHGCTVSKHCPMETSEQKTERENLIQVLGDDRSFPCARCPECSWFDPHIESLCGAGLAFGQPGWDYFTVRDSMSSDKFRADLEACPLREEQIQ